jgi:arylsulfatase A-like enzyme
MPATNRRDFIKSLGILTAGASFLQTPKAQSSQQKKPNVLFLFSDDQRFDTIGAHGNPHIKTPNLDRLVRRGTSFTRAYIMGGMNAAICCPSRAMLLTGRTLFGLPQGLTEPWKAPEPERGISPFATFPEVFRNAGYDTFGTGKWHNGKRLFAKGFTHGENIFFGGMSDHYKVPFHPFDPEGIYPEDMKNDEPTKHSSELFTDAAVSFLESFAGSEDVGSEKKFMMYVPYTAPHDPRDMPKEYLEMYDPEEIPLPPNFLPEHPFDNGELKVRDEALEKWPRTPEAIRGHIAAYYAMITHMDAQIGRVLNALDRSGQADNTIIVFAGDNGLAVGCHGLLGKQNLYEHSVHVPLIMSGPGIPENESRDALCYLSDIFPTLCGLTGLTVPETVEGSSLLPVIEGETESVRGSVFCAYKNFQRSVRTDRWKMIAYNVNGDNRVQLFDLKNDPWEMNNLAGDPDKAYLIRGLTSIMKDWIIETGDTVDFDAPGWGVNEIPKWGS